MYFEYSFDEKQQARQAVARDIRRAAKDEYQAVRFYTHLAKLAFNEQAKQVILRVRQDEIRHLYWFTNAFYTLTGAFPALSIGTLPKNFRQGIKDAIVDEGKIPAFYYGIALRLTDHQQIKRQFVCAAKDEKRHEQLFQHLLNQMSI